jgi:membrane protease YdiL (CAAX protease family)
MRDLMRKLPFPVEFAVVLGCAFGYAIAVSIMGAVHPPKGPLYSEAGMWRTVIVEACLLLALGGFLRLRGWTGKKLGLESHWTDGAWGLVIAVTSYFVMYQVFALIGVTAPSLAESAARVPRLPHVLTPWIVAAVVLLSSFYEEFFVTGYIVSALKDRAGLNIAVNVSVALRLTYHIYQGMIGVVLIIPIGLIFAYWYGKTGKLWPVIVAHALLNLISFLPYMKW